MNNLRLLLISFALLHCIIDVKAQTKNRIEVGITYDLKNCLVNMSIKNKCNETVAINDKATISMPGSLVYITFLKPEDSDCMSGYTICRRLGDTKSFVKLSPNQLKEYVFDVKSLKLANNLSNRIRVQYSVLYHVMTDDFFKIRTLEGKKIFKIE